VRLCTTIHPVSAIVNANMLCSSTPPDYVRADYRADEEEFLAQMTKTDVTVPDGRGLGGNVFLGMPPEAKDVLAHSTRDPVVTPTGNVENLLLPDNETLLLPEFALAEICSCQIASADRKLHNARPTTFYKRRACVSCDRECCEWASDVSVSTQTHASPHTGTYFVLEQAILMEARVFMPSTSACWAPCEFAQFILHFIKF
jgi:hypothetical protein